MDENFVNNVQLWVTNGKALEKTLESEMAGFLATSNSQGIQANKVISSSVTIPGDNPQVPERVRPTHKTFSPTALDVGGRSRKPSPIRTRRTYKAALLNIHSSPTQPTAENAASSKSHTMDSHQLNQSPPKSKTVFRRFTSRKNKKQEITESTEPLVPLERAEFDIAQAQHAEDKEVRQSHYEYWSDPQYQLRIEEGDQVSDMLTSLSKTLDLGSIVLCDQGNNLKYQMGRFNTANIQSLDSLSVCTTCKFQHRVTLTLPTGILCSGQYH